ncbi:MAG TPA: serine/threonine-protein kinase [Fibrobacteria bacterium]|nr:serine/threonine-protein kinase [Fibrobacteria bacterium]
MKPAIATSPKSDLPATLGPYHVLEPIGTGLGGMSDLYLCHDPSLDRKVVVKLVPNGVGDEMLNRFHREACLLSGVAHPGYAHVYRYWLVDQRPAMAMEFIDGLTLREILDLRRTIPLDVALSIAWTVAEALRHAHLHGIIHRDVKPANILISHAGQVKLLDFGVARFENQSDLTMPGMVVGTTSYMSAEQAKGEELDERSDLYSLALCTYESLAGRHPFRKDQPEASLTALLTKTPAPLWRIRPGTPWSVSRLVSATLSRDRRKRPRDASEFLSRVDRCLGRAGQDREAFLAAYMAAVRAGRKFASPLPRKGVSPWWFLAVGGVLGLAAGLAAAWR